MTREYKSSLREDQAEATRQRIVDALVEQACEGDRSDFSIADVAARAKVSERTVYRYFPTREALLDAVNEVIQSASRAVEPKSPDELEGHLRALYAWFEENPRLIEASHRAGVAGEVRASGRRTRGARAKQLVDEWLADLSEAERLRAFAVFRSFFGSFTWRTMRHELGLSAEETIDAVQWVFDLVLADLKKRKRAATAAKKKKTNGVRKKSSRKGGTR